MSSAFLTSKELIQLVNKLAASGKLDLVDVSVSHGRGARIHDLVLARVRQIIDGQSVQIELLFSWDFPLTLPVTRLVEHVQFGPLPHVHELGLICYVSQASIFVDDEDLERVICEVLDRVHHVLFEGFSGANCADFSEEFEPYWFLARPQETACSQVIPDHTPKRFLVARSRKNPRPSSIRELLFFDYGVSHRQIRKTLRDNKYRSYMGIAIRLPDGSRVSPPAAGSMWNQTEWSQCISQLEVDQRRELEELVCCDCTADQYVLLALPRPSGQGEALFGVSFSRTSPTGYRRICHPAIDAHGYKMRAIVVRHLDSSYYRERSGSISELGNKSVMVIGCGAVGGVVTELLARTGFNNISLVDHDKVSRDNLYRQCQAARNAGKAKVLVTAKMLKEQFPGLNVSTYPMSLQEMAQAHPDVLQKQDILLVAIGNPTVERWFNRWLYENSGPNTILTWLEPLGIGGHALLTRPLKLQGCYECLLEQVSSVNGSVLHNTASFAAAGQSFGKRMRACALEFMPFSALDAHKTACLAVDLAVKALTGLEVDSPLCSWRGSSSRFVAQGYHLAPRFEQKMERLQRNVEHTIYGCQKCRKRSETILSPSIGPEVGSSN